MTDSYIGTSCLPFDIYESETNFRKKKVVYIRNTGVTGTGICEGSYTEH